MAASLAFLGAAGTVTGARFLVEADGVALLLECGMGLRELRARNWAPPPVDPAKLAAVLLSPRRRGASRGYPSTSTARWGSRRR